MIFKDSEHEMTYRGLISKDKTSTDDFERAALFYILALNPVTRQHVNGMYNFDERYIRIESLNAEYQTSSSRRATKLAFNLFSGYSGSEHGKLDPSSLFCDSDVRYYIEAIKIRFIDYLRV